MLAQSVMVDVIRIQSAHMTRTQTELYAHARLVTQTRIQGLASHALVCRITRLLSSRDLSVRNEYTFPRLIIDSCQVKNGACDVNSICSHENSTFAVVCTCKTGYTNTGSASNVTCTGETIISVT